MTLHENARVGESSRRAWAIVSNAACSRLTPVAASDRGRLRPDTPSGPTSACRRCRLPAPPLDEPAALYWELIPGDDGEVVGVICEGCLTLREQRAIRAEKARVIRRLKRGLPL
jgi:hypothetical protein